MPPPSAADTAREHLSYMTQPDAVFRAAADQASQVMWIVNVKGAVTYRVLFRRPAAGSNPAGPATAWS